VRDVPLASKQKRILLIGDSFIEGMGVPYENSVAGILGESLKADATDVLNAAADPMIPVEVLPIAVEQYLAGADPRHPYASPLYGDPTGLPPTLILVGSDDVLRDDAVRMAEKMRAAGCDVEVEVWPRMFHVWPLLARVMPEARAAIARIGAFLEGRL
jgi:acetyl esterase/lipase